MVEQNTNTDRQALETERAGLKDLNAHLEEEYRKAEVSEKNYKELKEQYTKRLKEIRGELGEEPKPDPSETKVEESKQEPIEVGEKPKDVQPQQKQNPEPEVQPKLPEKTETPNAPEKVEEKTETNPEPETKSEAKNEAPKEEPKKGGFLSKIKSKVKKDGLKGEASAPAPEKPEKKDDKKGDDKGQLYSSEDLKGANDTEPDLDGLDPSDPKAIEKLAAQAVGQAGGGDDVEVAEEKDSNVTGDAKVDLELEKIKAVIESVKDTNKAIQESVTNLAESVGEVRTQVFQAEGEEKEVESKMERLADEVGEVKPKIIDTRIKAFNSKLDQADVIHEKLNRKMDDTSKKLTKIDEMLRSIGGVENLINVNKRVQTKLDDIKEALKYTERLAMKTEKIFIDLNKGLQDVQVYKVKQDGIDETMKDVLKSIDKLNVDMEQLPTQKDLETLRSDVFMFQKQLEEIKKILPVADAKIPESIVKLREERNNLNMFLDTLREHFEDGVITKSEYEDSKKKNEAKLEKVDKELRQEWKQLQSMMKKGTLPKEGDVEASTETPSEQPDELPETPEAPGETPSETPETVSDEKEGKPELEEVNVEDEKEAPSETPQPKPEESKPEGKYVCEICGEHFETGRSKGGHMSKHKKELEAKKAEEERKKQEEQVAKDKENVETKEDEIPKLAENLEETSDEEKQEAEKEEKEDDKDMKDVIAKLKQTVESASNIKENEKPSEEKPVEKTEEKKEAPPEKSDKSSDESSDETTDIIKKLKEKM